MVLKVPRKQFSPKQLSDFRREVAILSSIYHPNICLFMGAYVGDEGVIIVSELLVDENAAALPANSNTNNITCDKKIVDMVRVRLAHPFDWKKVSE